MAGLFPELCDVCQGKMIGAAVNGEGSVCYCDHRPPNRQNSGVLMLSSLQPNGGGFDSRVVAYISKTEARDMVRAMLEDSDNE